MIEIVRASVTTYDQPMADDITFYDDIEGYCGRLSVVAGGEVVLHVSTKSPQFDVVVERWGATREMVWSETGFDGVFTPPPADADAHGCHWPESVTVPVGDDWESGFYLVTLRASEAAEGRDVAHAGFVVRPAERRQRALLVLATNTWNAYNTWGGASLYTGGKEVSFRRPFGRGFLCRDEVERDDRKARPFRWGEEPDPDGEIYQAYRFEQGYPGFIGSSGWFTFERRFVEWAEQEGVHFDFAISSDLEDVPDLCDGYDLVLGVGHDEYWSGPQRDAVERHVENGGNYASFSGNTMFWQVRLAEGGGDAAGTMICHKYSAHETDPIMAESPTGMTGMWADPVVGRPETSFLGGGSAYGLYYRFGQAIARGSGAFTVYRDDHWLLAGTGLRYGDLLGATDGVVGYETLGCRIQFDEYQLPIRAGGDNTPEDLEIVAFTPASNLGVGEYPKSISALNDQGDMEFVAERLYGSVNEDAIRRVRHGNAVMVVARPFGPAGGEVVNIGTTDWTFGLSGDPAVSRVTKNVIARYLEVS